MVCLSCGYKEAGGNFCASCGAGLSERACAACGAGAAPGARFCASCGNSLSGANAPLPPGPPVSTGPTHPQVPTGGPAPAPVPKTLWAWGIAGLFLLGIALVVGIPRLIQGVTEEPTATPEAPFAGASAAPGGDPNSVDLSSMTPREAADRLWNRVVQAAEAGDSVEARTFVPMGIAAYQRAEPLDDDGLYHLSVLERIGGDFEGAIATAEQILATSPNHILALSAAGEAALEAREPERAAAYFQRLVDTFEEEQARGLPEYSPEAHARILPTLRESAQRALADIR